MNPNFKIDPNDRIDPKQQKRYAPLAPPKADKDFKDFLHVKEEPGKESKGKTVNKGKFEDELLASNALGAPVDHPPVSLFDLSAQAKKGDKLSGIGATESVDAAQANPKADLMEMSDGTMLDLAHEGKTLESASPFDLATNKDAGRKLAVDNQGNLIAPGDPRAIIDRSRQSSDTEFVEEKPDLVSIAQSQRIVVPEQINAPTPITEAKPTGGPDYKTIQQIVDQIVNKIYVVKEDGRSDTTIVLKNPPLFEGVKITLSSYESARGQYNITFENLTQMAKNVLDFQANRDALKIALDDVGVVVQMFTTTTATDTKLAAWETQQSRQNQQDSGGQGQQKQQKDEEEQT